MVPFDLMLTLVGFVLIGIGVYVFLSGRKRRVQHEGESNQFEAFGIRIAVSNPAVLLIMFGVVLVLTPRFMPGEGQSSGMADLVSGVQSGLGLEQEAATAASTAAAAAQTPVAVIAATPPAVIAGPVEPRPANIPATPVTSPTVPATVTRQQVAPPAVVAAKPTVARSPVTAKPAAVVKQPRPATIPKAAPKPPAVPAQVAIVPPPALPVPAKAALRAAVLTDATGSVEGVSVSVYRQKMKQALEPVTEELFADEISISDANPSFRKALRLKRLQDFCRQWQVDAILYAEVEPAAFEMGIESGNWPDAVFVLADCSNGEMRESLPVGLSPAERDRFPFHTTLVRAARRFYTQHLGMLGP